MSPMSRSSIANLRRRYGSLRLERCTVTFKNEAAGLSLMMRAARAVV